MPPDKILVVDDDTNICELLRLYLEKEGYTVFQAHDGEEALDLARRKNYGLILLDVMLPKIDGLSVCRQIREFSQVPVIMVTAKGGDMDKIMGLEYGADDYITKPFNILELKARIKAILRRSASGQNGGREVGIKTSVTIRELELFKDTRRVFVSGKEVNLTAKEFDLLELFMENPGKVYGRENLLNTVWGGEYPGDIRTVDVHVSRLREKIESGGRKYIATKWGVGYYFEI